MQQLCSWGTAPRTARWRGTARPVAGSASVSGAGPRGRRDVPAPRSRRDGRATQRPRSDKSLKTTVAASSSSAASAGSHWPSATRAASSSGTASRLASAPNARAVTSSRALASRRRARSPLDSSQASCLSSAASRSSTPSPVMATVAAIGGFHSPLARLTMARRSRSVAWVSGRSALFTTRTSATSRRPAFAAWMESPMPGDHQHDRGVGRRRDLHLGLADPDGLDQDDLVAGGRAGP